MNKKKYDYVIIGAGLFGSVFAHEAKKKNKKCLILDRRNHIGGNVFTYNKEGINVHKYGAHIFHTSNKKIWDYINQFSDFNHYINAPVANYRGKIYNLPFNMNLFSKLWDITMPNEAREIIENQIKGANIINIKNLEDQAISMVGKDIYEILIKEYTEKQWGKPCHMLPASIIKRLPVRFIYDNNYFNHPYQGIPIDGYTQIFKKLLQDIDIELGTNYLEDREYFNSLGTRIVYTGMIDEFYNYIFGVLEYRSLEFETEILGIENYQGNAVVNFTSKDVPYTRIIEHKHFEFLNENNKTIITKEYPSVWNKKLEPFYPINDLDNMNLYGKYWEMAKKENNIIFGGRLAEYKYYDMDQVINKALLEATKI